MIYNICYCAHNIIIYNICYCVHNIIIYIICYCVHNIIVRLVLIQQRRDSNSRADWPELRDDRLNVEIFQLGAKIAPLKTRRPKRRKNIASIAATCICTFHGIRSREKTASLLV